MIQTPKTIGNIPLDEPVNSFPSMYDFAQRLYDILVLGETHETDR